MGRAKGKNIRQQNAELILEYEQIMQEQKHYIDILKDEKYNLEQKLTIFESDRNTVLHVLNMTQMNSDEIIRGAQKEADEILLAARREADFLRNTAKQSIKEILHFEDTLGGILSQLQTLKLQIEADEPAKSSGIA